MTHKDLIRSIDLLRIATGLPTAAERRAKADKLIAESGVQMMPGSRGVLVQLRNGRACFLETKALLA